MKIDTLIITTLTDTLLDFSLISIVYTHPFRILFQNMNTIRVYIKPLYHRSGLFLRLPEIYLLLFADIGVFMVLRWRRRGFD